MHIAVITGGNNSEREVSLRSGKATFDSLESLGHQTSLYDFPVDTAIFLLEYKGIDLVFLIIHGAGGEDGQIASFLEVLGIPYHCTHPEVLHLTMNKWLTKQIWLQHDVPVAKDSLIDLRTETPIYIGLCVVKALDQGSSVGVWICKDEASFHTAIVEAKKYGRVMIEEFLEGREITVPVFDDKDGGEPMALPVIEIIPPEGCTFDYENKYNDKTQEICPADFDVNTTKTIQDIAVRAYKAVGCTKYGRIDMIINADGPKCLEINTIPGLTGASLFPKAAKEYGMSFPELIQYLIDLSIK